ncbi:MAG: hypothetical protein OK456_01260 [Thaumarchaeota archaeon]|nr:hypothetical protein [Nitrososphaerota archaeon]
MTTPDGGRLDQAAPQSSRRSKTQTVIVFVIVVLLATTATYGYYSLNNPRPVHSIQILSGVLSATNTSGNETSIASGLFWVQNKGTQPITSLTGTVPGLPDLQFAVNGGAPITPKNVLYPNQIALNLTVLRPGSLPFTNGSTYPMTIHATFADGSNITVTGTVPSQIPVPPSCYTNSSYAVNFQTDALTVNNSTNLATWVLSLNNTSPFPVNVVVVGVNNGTLWIPIVLKGQSISPTNQLSSGAKLMATVTWTNVSNTTRYFEWVGACPNQNAISTISGS